MGVAGNGNSAHYACAGGGIGELRISYRRIRTLNFNRITIIAEDIAIYSRSRSASNFNSDELIADKLVVFYFKTPSPYYREGVL